ncbi:Bromodomain-containing factor 1 [Cyphellophora attinorum]|uniref:Bromodomain-containing factor 1 n=1 Tax=Cyphellophora attinorum TaxID=1664694 RepID=A0A0N0NN15_9EURO|nr:Bromodomain-containing factor 1 [Phialophora attinorum]KPI40859.1 Bromodomain-containing factor 1 [Phialophora attinorum]
MDVELSLEAQGLPKQFGSTSEQPEAEHIASNVEASISNAEVASTAPVEANSTPNVDSAPAIDIAPPTTNGFHADDAAVNPTESSSVQVPAAPDSLPPTTTHASSGLAAPLDATTSATNSFADSIVPSSIPAETQSATQLTDLDQPSLASISDPAPQAPTSDLRSPPHADALSASEVAAVEAQKHAEDNAVTAIPPPVESLQAPLSAVPEQSETPVTLPPVSAVPEAVKLSSETGLATPPAQTPPPPPEPEHATLPAETTAQTNSEIQASQDVAPDSTPAPLASSLLTQPVEDAEMTEAPPVKTAREREEDPEDVEPSAKRMKTDEPETSFKVPDVPAAASPAASTPAPDGDDSVTQPRLNHMKKVISNLKKSNASASFRQPVDHVALKIPNYPEVVKHPMDLSKIDQKLKADGYTKISDFVADFDLIVNNCVLFNGKDHVVTQSAFKMQSSFKNQMQHLPKAQFAEPSKEEKKAARAKIEPTRTAPPRRPSVSTSNAPAPVAPSPKSAAAPAPAFAPGPDGIPLIRRDSNMADGRPKRQIVPTKRNNEFASGRPKKKKYELQLRFCEEVIKELTSPRNWIMNQYFTHPVDPVALNIPTYFQIIKKPMDLGTVQTKLQGNAYEKAKDFEEDVRLVFKNCYKFNPDGDYVNQQGHALEDLFNKKWATKDDWIAAREPPSEPQSDADEEDEGSESEEEDADDSGDERNNKIAQLQKQIAEMNKQMEGLSKSNKKKKEKSPNAPVPKKSKIKSKKEKPKTTFPGLQKPEKKKASKPPKEKFVTFAEKQYISNGIGLLPEKQMNEALRIIQSSMPNIASNDSEVELDIEEVPNHVLVKLLSYVKKYAGPPPEETSRDDDNYASAPTAPPKSKKNKPMTKAAQEAEIESLRGKLSAYDASGDAASPGAMQSIENDDDSDDDSSDESEED